MKRKRFFFAKGYVHITNSKQRKHRTGRPTALGAVANTDSKLLIYRLFQKGRVLAQDGGPLPWPLPSGRSPYIQIPTTAMLARPTSTSANLNMRSVSCDGIGTSSSPINALRTKCATRSSILDISASMTSKMAT